MIVKKKKKLSFHLLSNLVNSRKRNIFAEKKLALASAIFNQPKIEMHYTLLNAMHWLYLYHLICNMTIYQKGYNVKQCFELNFISFSLTFT